MPIQPGMQSSIYQYTYQNKPGGGVGVVYSLRGQPISREQFASETGQNVNAIEAGAGNPIQGNMDLSSQQNQPYPTQSVQPAGGGTTSGPSAEEIADAQAYYQDQIDRLNSLLDSSPGQLDRAIGTLNQNYGAQNTDLANQRVRAMQGYDTQTTQNAKDKQGGVEQVDQFANNSYNSLMRLLSGAGAGNSSVARSVVPTLVSKAGSTRRQGVFDTAGENQMNIDTARTDATDQYTNEQKSLDEWKKAQEGDLRTKAGNQNLSILQQIQDAQYNRAQAGGGGYVEAKAAGADTQSRINDTMSQLDSLFGNYQPTYTPKAINLTTPDLSKYQLDPATISGNQNMPQDTRYYGGMLKRKKELTY